MENKVIKLAMIILLASIYSFANAGEINVLAEYENPSAPLDMQYFSTLNEELLENGTDITSTIQAQCQQQQTHNSEYYEDCEVRVMKYRQKLTINNGVLEFKSKSNERVFKFNSQVSQQIQQQYQQRMTTNNNPTNTQLFYQCKSFLVLRKMVYRNISQKYFNERMFNHCIENGVDTPTCKQVSMSVIQQQQHQQINGDYSLNYSNWNIEGGSCQVILAE